MVVLPAPPLLFARATLIVHPPSALVSCSRHGPALRLPPAQSHLCTCAHKHSCTSAHVHTTTPVRCVIGRARNAVAGVSAAAAAARGEGLEHGGEPSTLRGQPVLGAR